MMLKHRILNLPYALKNHGVTKKAFTAVLNILKARSKSVLLCGDYNMDLL